MTTYSPGARAYAQSRSNAFLDLSAKDMSTYSLSRCIRAASEGHVALAPFENEVSQAVAARIGRSPQEHAFFVPSDMLVNINLLTRDMTSAGVSGSDYLVGGQQLSFVDLIRARSVVMRLGAELATGLTGNVNVPRNSADIAAYWLTNEVTAITEGQPTVGNISLTPKHVGAYTEVSRLLNLQSKAADALIFASLAKAVGVAVDRAALRGAGSGGEPQGIIGTSGVGTFTGTSLNWAALINAQEDVIGGKEIDLTKCGWAFTSAVSTLLMGREKISTSGNMLWEGAHGNGIVAGCPACATNSLSAGTGIFGSWDQLLVGEWGELEILVNPFQAFSAGILGMRAFYAVDIAVRDASAFSTTSSIT